MNNKTVSRCDDSVTNTDLYILTLSEKKEIMIA